MEDEFEAEAAALRKKYEKRYHELCDKVCWVDNRGASLVPNRAPIVATRCCLGGA